MSWQGLYGRNFPIQRPYQPLIVGSARAFNPMIRALNNLHRRRVNPGLIGIEAASIQNEVGIIKISTYARLISASGSGGAYTWQGLTGNPDTPGGWLDDPSVSDYGGADLAYEANNNSKLAAQTRVYMEREETTGAWVFRYDTCTGTPMPPSPLGGIPQKLLVPFSPPLPRGLFQTTRQQTGVLTLGYGNGLQQQTAIPP